VTPMGHAVGDRRGPQGGFTLIEMVVVLVIAGMVAGVAAPMVANALPGVQLKAKARELAAVLRYARDRALTHREETVVTVDTEGRTFGLSGREERRSLPESFDIKLLVAESESPSDTIGGVRFFPTGGSTGGRVTLAQGDRGYKVDVDWLTGRVRILE